jgi:hypothetical protein
LVTTLSRHLLSLLGAIPVTDNLFICRVLFLHKGQTQELLPHGPWNSWQGSVPSSRMSIWGNSFHNQWNPRQGTMPIPMGSAWGNPSQSPLNVMPAQPSTSYFENHPMMSPHTQNPYTSHGHGFYQNLGQQPKFSWQPSASQTPGPIFHGYYQQPIITEISSTNGYRNPASSNNYESTHGPKLPKEHFQKVQNYTTSYKIKMCYDYTGRART